MTCTVQGAEYIAKDDWGEQLTSVVDPVVVVMSVKSEECEVVEIGEGVSGEDVQTCRDTLPMVCVIFQLGRQCGYPRRGRERWCVWGGRTNPGNWDLSTASTDLLLSTTCTSALGNTVRTGLKELSEYRVNDSPSLSHTAPLTGRDQCVFSPRFSPRGDKLVSVLGSTSKIYTPLPPCPPL